MLEQAQDGVQRAGAHVRAYFRALDDVQRVADGGCQYLGLEALYVIDVGNLCDQLYAIPAAVVYTANEGRNVGSARFGGQYGLPGGEYQGTVGLDLVLGKPPNGLYAVLDHRHLYHDAGVQGGQLLAFCNNAVEVGSDHFRAYIAFYHFADGFIMLHNGFFAP